MKQRHLWLGLTLAALGCEAEDDKTAGTDVGNPVVLALRAEPMQDAAVVDGAQARYRLVSASGQVREVTLAVAGELSCADLGDLPGGTECTDGPTTLTLPGSLTADLVAGTLAPEAKVPGVAYDEARLRSGASEQAQGLIIELAPEDDGRVVRIEVAPSAALAFDPVEGEAGSFIADPAAWIGTVDLLSCAGAQPGEGPLRITLDPTTGACEPAQGR